VTKANPKVDGFFRRAKKWKEELEELRSIVLDNRLTEEMKWGQPCYTLDGKNVIIIHAFKEYCALLFFKGALLKDPKGILIRQTENVHSSRQIRFTNVREIVKLNAALKAYVRQAIEVEVAGLTVEKKKTSDFKIPEEFQNQLDDNPALATAFHSLTPGRQRAYLLYFSSAKQSKTRTARVVKHMPRILKGKGLDD
jgi:uncharacterized protein YdeI (YjbR/CyaY-like superfamily)